MKGFWHGLKHFVATELLHLVRSVFESSTFIDCDILGVASQPPPRVLDEPVVPKVPFTSRSKSISGSSDPPLVPNALSAPNDMKSSLAFAFEPFEPDNSWRRSVLSECYIDENIQYSNTRK
jgi:hypothetical protein